MIHYWRTEGQDKYYMRIPIWENYIIYFKTLFKDDKRYEFVKYWKKIRPTYTNMASLYKPDYETE